MGIGVSLVLIGIGAILRFAVYRQDLGGFSVGTIGVILMIVGAVGLIIALILLTMRRRTDVVVRRDRTTYIEPGPPPDY
jgi:tetrahydromethanopterin S-methyltransferase subunit E